MKKHDLSIIVVGLMFFGVSYLVLTVVAGFTIYVATSLAVLGWVLVVLAAVVNSWSSAELF